MRIKSLFGLNFKGDRFEHELAPVTLIYGDNFQHKSARLEALTLAVGGYLPGDENIGGPMRSGSVLFKELASGNPMVVQVKTDDAANGVITRQYEQVKGSVKVTESEFRLPPVAIDAFEYLKKSGPEQIKFLFSKAVLPEKFTHTALSAAITANLKNIKLDENTPASEAVIAECIGMVEDLTTHDVTGEIPPQAWLTKLAEEVNEKKKAAVAGVQRMEKTAQGLTVVADQELIDPDAEQKYEASKTAFGVAQAKSQLWFEELKRLENQGEEAKEAANIVANCQTTQTKINFLKADLHEHQKKSFTPVVHIAPATLKAAQKVYDDANRDKQNADDAASLVGKELEQTKKEKVCSKCGQSISKLQKKIIKTLQESLESIKLVQDAALKVLSRAVEDLSGLNALDAKNKAEEKAYNAHIARENELRNEIEKVSHGLPKESTIELANKLPVLRDKYRKAKAESVMADAETQKARDAVSKADVAYKRMLADRAEAQSRAKVAEERIKSKIEAQVMKRFADLLAELRDELVVLTVGPIIAKANQLCGTILKAPLEYRDGVIGLMTPGKFVTPRTMSGTEKALVCCALSVALSADSKAKLLLLDEATRLDAKNRVKLVQLACKLQEEGVIDQAVLVGTENIACDSENFAAIEVTDGATASR